MELPNPPLYRRWSVLLAAVIVLAAIAAMLGWRGFQEVATPSTTTTVPSTSIATTTTAPPPPSTSTSKPDLVLWQHDGTGVVRSRGFEAPDVLADRVASSTARTSRISAAGTSRSPAATPSTGSTSRRPPSRAKAAESFNKGGYGRLLVESVCDTWSVRVLSG